MIAFGIYLRISQYVVDRSLWLDEAMLALNITKRSFVELTQQLDYDQGAPIGFLFLQKVMIRTLGNEDYILRLFPFMAGIAAMFLMYHVTKGYVGSRELPIALGLFAVSDSLIYYASEAKQYSSDVMISLLLLLLACSCVGVSATLKHFIILGFVGALSLLIAHPALFVLIGIGFSLTLDVFFRKNRRRYLWLGTIFFFWLTSFAILYFISLRFLATNETLLNYWSSAFMPMPPWRNIGWFHRTFFEMFSSPVGLTNTLISTILFFLGGLSLFSRNWQLALILLIPFLTTLIASGFGMYPFSGRLLLFVVPMVILLITEGIGRSYLTLRKYNFSIAIAVWITLALLLIYKPTETALQNLNNPQMKEHIKPVMAYLRENRVAKEPIYVYYGAWAAFQFYAPSYGFEPGDYNIGVSSRQKPEKYIQDIAKLDGQGHVWYIFSHNCSWCIVDEKKYFLKHLDKLGVKMDEFESSDSSVYLYDMSLSEP